MPRAIKDWGGVLLGLLGSLTAAAALYVQYEARIQDGPIKERLATVETQQKADDKRLDEIRSDVSEIRKDVGEVLRRLPSKP